MPRQLFVSALLLLPVFAAAESAPHLPTNEDLRHLGRLAHPLLSPDGKLVLLEVTESTADGAKSHEWLIDVAGGEPRQLTYSPEADKGGEHAGAWMPDGASVLFLAHRGEHTQLFRLPMNGGEAKAFDLKVKPAVDRSKDPDALPPQGETPRKDALASADDGPVEIDILSYAIAPDGRHIAIIAADPQTPGEKRQGDAKADATDVNHETHEKRLYFLDPATSSVAVTSVPGDVQSAVWKRDSSALAALSEEPNEASDLHPATSAWVVSPQEPAKAERIAALPATTESLSWSSDGNALALLAQAGTDTPPGYSDLYRYSIATKTLENLSSPSLHVSAAHEEPLAMRGGATLLSVDQGVTVTTAKYTGSARPEILHYPLPVVQALATNERESGWVFLGQSSTTPPALYMSEVPGGGARILKTPPVMPAGLEAVAARRITWKSDHTDVEGLLYLPVAASSAAKVPLIVDVHGGPLGNFNDGYEAFVQFLVGHGWAVLRTNPRGSTGYGAGFAAANKNDLGGGDYRDIMAGVDSVLKTEPVDAQRMALMGYSYGGEMAGFVEGKTTRFRAIVSGAPVIDQYSEYGTESDSWYDRWYFGKPWEHPADAWRQSPLSFLAGAATPMLLLQGEADTTDPVGQSEEMYRALRQRGVPVDLVTYPREDHGPLAMGIFGAPSKEPWHGFDARARIARFLTQYLK